ncbi:coniferyl aldehyde dehydrogenase [Parendozoicomonas haliclonae]|uniref:Aldehyde dehydrogenase n=1 Tax=Parendozoicomonas haliclonae TaxID=1960125 RepID=A0A1X7ANL8_9GAMM|nr:coniferyl aldehyde dehydrogenase [Parendozoicomonas haliclonae]SMA48577.1 Coniferyl aldehyde dehydrogenase [Parendozoicomonas haliclonae]
MTATIEVEATDVKASGTATVTMAETSTKEQLRAMFDRQKRAFRSAPMPSREERIQNLQRLKTVLLDNQDAIIDAISEDFAGRSRDETLLGELMPIAQDINYTCKKLKKWMKPSKRHVGQHLQPAKAVVNYQPLGVVGIMVPWNYPVQLAVLPMVGALAAGNRVMVKMSEFTPKTAELFAKLMEDHFSEELISVVTGEVDVATEFSKLPFDHLLFTGSTQVGRIVMRAAAENLTPVTLELGGKSPAIISDDVDLTEAVERICFGKSFNAGQTCVAPDYILCPRSKQDAFIETYRKVFNTMYPKLNNNADYTSIVNERMHQRLQSLVTEAKEAGAGVHVIGESDINDGSRRMPLHIITDASDDLRVMQEEIFGPVMPVIPYDNLNEALDYVNDRPRPLALYLFSHEQDCQRRVLEQTHSGGVCVNETLLHVAVDDMPFGGVGPSGMGHYHGHEGFLTFSKAKGTLSKGKFNAAKFMYPPYGGALGKMIFKMFVR